MPENNATPPSLRRNPLLWVTLVVIGLIVFLFQSDERGTSSTQAVSPVGSVAEKSTDGVGTIDRNSLIPPGMRARQYIEQIRDKGKPYLLDDVFAKAGVFFAEGSLADAQLLYFFAGREGHLPSMIKLAQMSDPILFHAENSLLDHADVIQAYKWYKKASAAGSEAAAEQLIKLHRWATTEARFGNRDAKQLLLNFE